jgi:NitT/TauT family transport system substrate-binding protein
LDKDPGLVKSFVAATREGWQRYLDDAKATNELLHGLNPALAADTLTAAAEAEKPLIVGGDAAQLGIGAMTRARWEALASTLLSLKLLDKPLDVNAAFWAQPAAP